MFSVIAQQKHRGLEAKRTVCSVFEQSYVADANKLHVTKILGSP